MKRYRCITKCYHNLRLWNPGDILGPVAEGTKVPPHFVPVGVRSEPEVQEKEVETFHELNEQQKEEERIMLERAGIGQKPQEPVQPVTPNSFG